MTVSSQVIPLCYTSIPVSLLATIYSIIKHIHVINILCYGMHALLHKGMHVWDHEELECWKNQI
jgi:hypothetical protein